MNIKCVAQLQQLQWWRQGFGQLLDKSGALEKNKVLRRDRERPADARQLRSTCCICLGSQQSTCLVSQQSTCMSGLATEHMHVWGLNRALVGARSRARIWFLSRTYVWSLNRPQVWSLNRAHVWCANTAHVRSLTRAHVWSQQSTSLVSQQSTCLVSPCSTCLVSHLSEHTKYKKKSILPCRAHLHRGCVIGNVTQLCYAAGYSANRRYCSMHLWTIRHPLAQQ